MKFNPRLQTILAVNFILVALVPVVAIGFITLHLLTTSLKKDIVQKNSLLAQSLAGEVKRYLAEPQAVLGQAATVIQDKGMLKSSDIDGFLETTVASYPFLSCIQMIDHKGWVIHMAPFREDSVGIDLSEQPFFKVTSKTHTPYLSPTFISVESLAPTMVMTRPMDQGMLVGYISLEDLSRITGRVKIGEKGYAVMTDREGAIIAHPNAAFVAQRLNIKQLEIIRQGLMGKEGTFSYRFDGVKNLGCVAVVPSIGWPVVVVQPLDEAFAPVRRLQRVFLWGISFSVILALSIAFFSLKKIVTPFSRLISDTGNISQGNYQIPPHRKSYPEIDALADDFRIMAVSLAAREVALQQSEEKYRNLVEGSFDGIFIQKGPRIIFANQRLCEMLGYDWKELAGLDHWRVYHPEYRDLTRERAQARMRGETVTSRYEVKLLRKDGSWFFGEVSAKAIQLNGEAGIQVWINDLTDRKEAGAAVLRSEKRFRDLFNAISDLIYTQDLEGRFLSANPAMCALFGYHLREFLGRRALDFMDPEVQLLFESEYLEVLKTKGRYEGVSGYKAKDGRRIFIEYHSTLVKPEEGEPYISGIGRDVTERIHSKKQLKMLREQVAQAEKMKAIGVLAGGVAHDFNNLLMGIQGNASLMLLTVSSTHPHHEKLKNIEKYVQQGADLTRQLLGFARGGKYEVKPTEINRLLEDELRPFQRTRKELMIHRDYQEGIWIVDIDRGQIIQALLNLLINAWQAMPGGGDLQVQTRNVKIDEAESGLHQVDPGKYVKISIRDSGVGMDEGTLARIFEPFFTTKGMGRGTGLGLASVYGTIKNHGGFIHVESEPGQGTVFHIHLPASMSTVKETNVSVSAVPFQGKGEKILLVDDEEMILDVGEQMLEKLGYGVITANRGEAAVEISKREKDGIAMVILDMIMPGMGGGETYDRLKEIKKDAKVLLSSGYSIDGQAREILDRGCSGFIQKPFNLETLSRMVRKVLIG